MPRQAWDQIPGEPDFGTRRIAVDVTKEADCGEAVVQTVTLTLDDGRQVYYTGPMQIDTSDGKKLRVVDVSVTTSYRPAVMPNLAQEE